MFISTPEDTRRVCIDLCEYLFKVCCRFHVVIEMPAVVSVRTVEREGLVCIFKPYLSDLRIDPSCLILPKWTGLDEGDVIAPYRIGEAYLILYLYWYPALTVSLHELLCQLFLDGWDGHK